MANKDRHIERLIPRYLADEIVLLIDNLADPQEIMDKYDSIYATPDGRVRLAFAYNVFHRAVAKAHIPLVKYMVESKKYRHPTIPMLIPHALTIRDELETIEGIIEGSDVDEQIVSSIERDPNSDNTNNWSISPLEISIKDDRVDILDILIPYIYSYDKEHLQSLPLFLTTKYADESVKVLDYLLERSDISEVINSLDSSGRTPAMSAAVYISDADVIWKLIAKGSDVLKTDCMKGSLLHFLCAGRIVWSPKFLEITNYLLDRKIETVRWSSGCGTPLELTVSNICSDASMLLREFDRKYVSFLSIKTFSLKGVPIADVVRRLCTACGYKAPNDALFHVAKQAVKHFKFLISVSEKHEEHLVSTARRLIDYMGLIREMFDLLLANGATIDYNKSFPYPITPLDVISRCLITIHQLSAVECIKEELATLTSILMRFYSDLILIGGKFLFEKKAPISDTLFRNITCHMPLIDCYLSVRDPYERKAILKLLTGFTNDENDLKTLWTRSVTVFSLKYLSRNCIAHSLRGTDFLKKLEELPLPNYMRTYIRYPAMEL